MERRNRLSVLIHAQLYRISIDVNLNRIPVIDNGDVVPSVDCQAGVRYNVIPIKTVSKSRMNLCFSTDPDGRSTTICITYIVRFNYSMIAVIVGRINPRFFRVSRIQHNTLTQSNGAVGLQAERAAESRDQRTVRHFAFVGIGRNRSDQKARHNNKYGQNNGKSFTSRCFPGVY